MIKNEGYFFIPKEYQDIVVSTTSMPVSFSRHILLDTLNEDTDLQFVPPRFQTIYLQDELFARVWLTAIGQSTVTHVAVR